MDIIKVTHSKGATTEAYIATVRYRGNKVKAVFNCLTGDMSIFKWYLYADDFLIDLRRQLITYFESLVDDKKNLL